MFLLAMSAGATVDLHSQFGTLREAGIEAGLLHAKTMTVDGRWATIGSTDRDTRSFALNEDLNAEFLSLPVRDQM